MEWLSFLGLCFPSCAFPSLCLMQTPLESSSSPSRYALLHTSLCTSTLSFIFFLLDQMSVCLMLSWRSLRRSFLSFHSFSILLCFHYFHHSMFQLTYPVFCLNDSAVVLLKCIFYFNYCVVIKHFLYILNPHLNPIYLCLHFISEILDHLYYHYSEFSFR